MTVRADSVRRCCRFADVAPKRADWCPCANQASQGSYPRSNVGAVPTLSGAQCYSTASSNTPAAGAATTACATSILTSFASTNGSVATSGTLSGAQASPAAGAGTPAAAAAPSGAVGAGSSTALLFLALVSAVFF